jgi:hypothetical protein
MACEINASPSNGLVQSADGSGVIKLKSNGVTTNALAWVNFNGTGTVAIRSSYNVSSITDNGTGDYTVNFATALSDADYVVATTCPVISDQGSSYQFGLRTTTNTSTAPTTKTTSAVRMLCRRESDNDVNNANVVIFGN